MDRAVVDIPPTPRERSLILRYGDPCARLEQALKAVANSRAIEIVPVDRFELERLIGDLCRSINDTRGGTLQDQLLDLRDRLKAAERYGHGMLDKL